MKQNKERDRKRVERESQVTRDCDALFFFPFLRFPYFDSEKINKKRVLHSLSQQFFFQKEKKMESNSIEDTEKKLQVCLT